ncbi:hypothetical protein pdam_00025672 [Pocillopora damicornis]|uniref:Uncharacterized protein n=1 Tax=Pocillopora damicornis TaxID=46731 RepID=A0A3M6UJM5_POCDA|nr:hypothetical protein pdam_00025672 [Pocillopora damicornis]
MADEYEVFIEASVRGYHAYFKDATVVIVEAECIGARYNRGEGKGLEFPVDYKLSGNKRYLEKLVSSIKKKETRCNLNISEVRECQDQNS